MKKMPFLQLRVLTKRRFCCIIKKESQSVHFSEGVFRVKTYAKYETVLQNITESIAALRKSGTFVLDGERGLSAEFDASRGTIRKVLKQLEEGGMIRREGYTTRILPECPQKKRYAYIVLAHDDSGAMWFPFFQRVWDRLEKLLLEHDLSVDLIMLDPEQPDYDSKAFCRRLLDYDLLFTTLIPPERCPELPELPVLQICIQSDFAPADRFMKLELDDVRAGELAAQLLAEAGVRRAAVIFHPGETPSFRRRIDGFLRVFHAAGGFPEYFHPESPDRLTQIMALRDYVNTLPEREFDGIFFVTDEFCNLILEDLLVRGQVPDPISVVALDGSSTARTMHPPVTTVSHAVQPTADAVLRLIQKMENGTFRYRKGAVLLTPSIHQGKSIKLKQKNKEMV